MKCMDKYFTYSICCICGIPRVKLLGTVEDWRSLSLKMQGLREYGCGDWVDAVAPILDKFTAAYEGEVDTVFWDLCARIGPTSDCG